MVPENNITEEATLENVAETATASIPETSAPQAVSSERDGRKNPRDRRNDRGGRRDRGDKKDKPKKEFDELLLEVRRVTRVTTGGRRMSFRATILVGNKKGKI
jgi:small subunit ribosomal protein S5